MSYLTRGERQYMHFPFWGLEGITPEIQVGKDAAWAPLTAEPGYTPPAGWEPPDDVTGDPSWWHALLASPEAEDNPPGAFVITGPTRIRTRAVGGDEIDIKPDTRDEWVILRP